MAHVLLADGPKNWSSEFRWDADDPPSLGGTGFQQGFASVAETINDQRVSFEILIDLDQSQQTLSYNGVVVSETVWHRTGDDAIRAINLHSDDGSVACFDNLRFAQVTNRQAAALSTSGLVLLGLLLLTAGFFVAGATRRRLSTNV